MNRTRRTRRTGSARSGTSATAPAQSTPPTSPRPPRARRWRIVVPLAVVLGVALVLTLRGRAPQAPSADVATPAIDSIAAMPGPQALQRALWLEYLHQHAQSLPYFRRALEVVEPPASDIHAGYAFALFNSVYQLDTLGNVTRPVWPTSPQRVAVMRECLDEIRTAIRTAPNARDRAYCENQLGRFLQVWGFQYETLIWYRRAADTDPHDRYYAGLVNGYIEVLVDPVHAPDRLPQILGSALQGR